jgi:cytochrome c oxidase cbb3-type subunit IV
MYKNVLENINGVDIYPVISLVVFFLFFLGVVIWAFRADKSYITKMGNLPLENSMGKINNQSAEV